MEAVLVERAGIRFEAIPAAGLHGVGVRALPGNLGRLLAGVPAAGRIIERFDPDAIFLTGGYVGVPVAIAGRRRPQVVFVPDVEPGLALRLISRFADLIMVSSEAARASYSTDKRVIFSGYPTRPEFSPVAAEEARIKLGLQPDLSTLLVFGGSRGAHSINQALWGCLPRLLDFCQVVHITGTLDWPLVSDVQAALTESHTDRYHPSEYMHEQMPLALSAADLVVSRAGAATMGEYPLFSLPAILVPYPHAWRYQRVNAEQLESAGGAVVLDDARLHETLFGRVQQLLADPDELANMRSAMGALRVAGAAERIAEAILTMAQARSG